MRSRSPRHQGTTRLSCMPLTCSRPHESPCLGAAAELSRGPRAGSSAASCEQVAQSDLRPASKSGQNGWPKAISAVAPDCFSEKTARPRRLGSATIVWGQSSAAHTRAAVEGLQQAFGEARRQCASCSNRSTCVAQEASSAERARTTCSAILLPSCCNEVQASILLGQFAAGETKTRQAIDAPLPRRLTAFVEKWIEDYRPGPVEGRSGRCPLDLVAGQANGACRCLPAGLHRDRAEAGRPYHFRELLWTREDGGNWRQLDNVKVGESQSAEL